MSWTLSDFMKTRVMMAAQPAPLLAFYELELPDSTFLRYVDFFDQEITTSGQITFNGESWTAVDIYRGPITHDLEESQKQLVLSVYDPLHAVAYFIRTHKGLSGQKLTIWITTEDHLDTPADAWMATFNVLTSYTTQGPDLAHIVLGHSNLFEAKFPKLFYDRRRCWNPYQNRFTPGGLCNYPSNEFGAQDEWDYFIGGVTDEQERWRGWWTQQASRAKVFDANVAVAGALRVTSEKEIADWLHDHRYGPCIYRFIDGDFDVWTDIAGVSTSRDHWEAGILVQDLTSASPDPESGEPPPPIPTSDWVIFGTRDPGTGQELFSKNTDADLTTTATYASTDPQIRVARSGGTFTCYSRPDSSSSWTQRAQLTASGIPTEARVGLVISSEDASTYEFGADFDFIRFTAGGLSSCRRDYEDCLAHDNLLQFNGWREIPNDRGRYSGG